MKTVTHETKKSTPKPASTHETSAIREHLTTIAELVCRYAAMLPATEDEVELRTKVAMSIGDALLSVTDVERELASPLDAKDELEDAVECLANGRDLLETIVGRVVCAVSDEGFGPEHLEDFRLRASRVRHLITSVSASITAHQHEACGGRAVLS